MFFKFKSLLRFLFSAFLSAKKRIIPKINVVHAIILRSLKIFIKPNLKKIKPKIIKGIDPKKIKFSKYLFLKTFLRSFQKYIRIANNDPKCRLTSTSNEEKLNSLILENKTKCAEELTGTNSDTPCPGTLILGSWGVIYWYQNVMILITGFNQTNEHNLRILEM